MTQPPDPTVETAREFMARYPNTLAALAAAERSEALEPLAKAYKELSAQFGEPRPLTQRQRFNRWLRRTVLAALDRVAPED